MLSYKSIEVEDIEKREPEIGKGAFLPYVEIVFTNYKAGKKRTFRLQNSTFWELMMQLVEDRVTLESRILVDHTDMDVIMEEG